MPGLAVRVDRVAFGTLPKALLDGARMVMFWAEDSAETTPGTKPSTEAN